MLAHDRVKRRRPWFSANFSVPNVSQLSQFVVEVIVRRRSLVNRIVRFPGLSLISRAQRRGNVKDLARAKRAHGDSPFADARRFRNVTADVNGQKITGTDISRLCKSSQVSLAPTWHWEPWHAAPSRLHARTLSTIIASPSARAPETPRVLIAVCDRSSWINAVVRRRMASQYYRRSLYRSNVSFSLPRKMWKYWGLDKEEFW